MLRTLTTATFALVGLIASGYIASSIKGEPVDHGVFSPPHKSFIAIGNFKGVNLGDAQGHYPNQRPVGYEYIYPQSKELDYWASQGFGLIRFLVSARRLQPESYGGLDPDGRKDEPQPFAHYQLESMKGVIDHAYSIGLYVVIDPHDFGFISDTANGNISRPVGADEEGSAQLADWWARVATKFKKYPNVIFGLMNEPNAVTPEQWKKGAIQSIEAIREVGAKQLILIPGANYSAAYSWNGNAISNGGVWAGFHGDPENNFAFEVHQYLDIDSSGQHAACQVGQGARPLIRVTDWARQNHFKLFLGEFGWSPDPTCPTEAAAFLNQLTVNADVWMGWSYFIAGSYLFEGGKTLFNIVPNYQTTPPTEGGGGQLELLRANL